MILVMFYGVVNLSRQGFEVLLTIPLVNSPSEMGEVFRWC